MVDIFAPWRTGFTADGRNYDGSAIVFATASGGFPFADFAAPCAGLDRKGYLANGQYALDKDGYDSQNRNLQNFDRQGFSPEGEFSSFAPLPDARSTHFCPRRALSSPLLS